MRFSTEVNSVERFLATTIGNFLFDDIVITESLNNNKSNVNRIHILNLNGIYIPLSVFLEAAYQAFINIEDDYTKYVKVKYHSKNIEYSEQTDGLTSSDWDKLYNNVTTGSTVSFHFFGDFTSYISNFIKT
jgi:hypothetical protein